MISWDLIDASEPHHSFIYDPQLAPGEAKELTPNKVDLAHLAPEGSRQLAFPGGVNVRVTWLLLTDNASRRWIIRPLGGRPQDQVVVEAGPEEYAAQVVAKPCGP
jgi:hypothetical protein